jgi:hypothetical protein
MASCTYDGEEGYHVSQKLFFLSRYRVTFSGCAGGTSFDDDIFESDLFSFAGIVICLLIN